MSRALLALESFLAFSEAMACAAEEQEWETLVRLGEERGKLFDGLPVDLGATLPPEVQAHARSIIDRCQLLDAQTCSCVEARRKAIGVLLQEPLPVN